MSDAHEPLRTPPRTQRYEDELAFEPPVSRIVVVLDEAAIETETDDAADFVSILEAEGYRVRRGRLDEAAAPLVMRVQPGLVLASIDGRDLRVADLATRLVNVYGAISPPIVVITSSIDDVGLRALLDAGVRDVLSKPILPALLRAKVTQYFRDQGVPREPIGGFRVKRRLGAGGMGTVYVATGDAGDVALKVLDMKLAAADPELLARFRRESEVLRSLDGTGAPRFLAAGRSGSFFYCAMEYIRGATLYEVLEKGSLAPGDVRRLVIEIARALVSVHRLGIVHRDVKPGNIMISRADGAAKLIDYGLARAATDLTLTSSSCVLGTVAYMAPEILRGALVDARADIFSLGMTALEGAIGRCPMVGTNMEIMTALAKGQVPRAASLLPRSFDPALARVLAGMLEPEPERRVPLEKAISELEPSGA